MTKMKSLLNGLEVDINSNYLSPENKNMLTNNGKLAVEADSVEGQVVSAKLDNSSNARLDNLAKAREAKALKNAEK